MDSFLWMRVCVTSSFRLCGIRFYVQPYCEYSTSERRMYSSTVPRYVRLSVNSYWHPPASRAHEQSSHTAICCPWTFRANQSRFRPSRGRGKRDGAGLHGAPPRPSFQNTPGRGVCRILPKIEFYLFFVLCLCPTREWRALASPAWPPNTSCARSTHCRHA